MNRTVGYVLALVGDGWCSFGIWVFYNVRFLQYFRRATPLSVSAQYLPAVIAGLLAAGMTGFMLAHAPVSFVMMISMVAFCVGIIVACFQPVQQTYWAQTFVSNLIMPFEWTSHSLQRPSFFRTTCRQSIRDWLLHW
jgi:glucan phosphoethanolaminetransferase (alkaline phosphatase superfamily)